MDSERVLFVQKCGELLHAAKPSLICCELKLGKNIPYKANNSSFMPDGEYVVVTCINKHIYTIYVDGNSLATIAAAIFTKMLHK